MARPKTKRTRRKTTDELTGSGKGFHKTAPVTNYVNKVGQSFAQDKKMEEGEDVFGNKKSFPVDDGPFHCKKPNCEGIVRYDHRGYAACEVCGDIYNDGVAHAQKAKARAERDAEKAKKKANGDFRVSYYRKS